MIAGVFVGSVWIENHYPSGDTKRALSQRTQNAITKPLVNILSRQVERAVRNRAEAAYMNTGLTEEETIARFLDERRDFTERRDYAYRLARVGSAEALAALRKVLPVAPPEHRAFMAELIGSTGNAAVKPLLWPLVEDADQHVVISAMRGLSAIGGEDVSAFLGGILSDAQRAEPLRFEAALGLGTVGTSAARDALVASFSQAMSSDLGAQVLVGLGRFEFPTVAGTFEKYLAAPEMPRELRVAAVEALASSSVEAVPFLAGIARNDLDAEVRAAAAWSISTHEAVEDLAPTLADLAEREPVPDVRRRLYEALVPQTAIPGVRLLPLVQAEHDIAARVAGFNAVGRVAQQEPSSPVAATFDKDIVPELQQIATAPNSLNIQMRAVFALRRAQTAAAQTALATIAGRAVPQVATAARNGLRTGNP